MARGSQATQPEDAGGGASPRFENSISEAPRITEIEFSEVDGENIMKPVFNRTPVTCLSIFDSILFQSFLDGSTIAFDLSTRQSFPLTGTRPMAFFPPLLPLECSSSDASSDASDAEDAPPTASRAPPPRPPEPAGKPPEPALPGGEDAVPPRHITSAVTEGAISPHSIPVRELEDLSPETFARTPPDAFEPLLLTGATRGWAAHERWTFPFFAAGALGQTHVTVTGRDGKRSEMTLGAYIGLFRTDDGLHSRARDDEDRACGYLRGWTYEHDDESLKNDFALPHFAHDWFGKLPKRDDPCFRWIFLGPGGSKTPLHVDPCLTHAWLAQIRGRKRFILYKPAHLQHVYDAKGNAADVRAPDRLLFPSFDLATPYEVVLEAGDLLFVPAGWAHQVECVDDSISLTHNFLPKLNFSAVRACLLANRLGKTVLERREGMCAPCAPEEEKEEKKEKKEVGGEEESRRG